MISRRSALIMLLGAALSGEACAQNLTPRGDSTSNALALRVVQLAAGSDPNVLALMASYGKGDDETKFVIELQNESHGLFRHVPGSHPVRFLEELKRALVAS
ncbi:hypothetical protein [Rhizobium sp. BK376]|uniref:hypothetical protein n=1 Tax=Rhizobium sp. BK376 TaxID=2512149 RepID=UPI0010D3934D|nr:hypothetical protein [Rhizobium sp. BK376]TCR85231.1 hypothetical protein EV561_1072 [Rhizobium sp. BK376]